MHTTWRVLAGSLLGAVLAGPVAGEPIFHLGPAPTRDQFPPNLFSLAYQPAPPDPMAPGAWEADLQCVEANTLEFSDVIKDSLPANPAARINLSQQWAEGIAAANPSLPVIFLFQMETTLTTLRLRAGTGLGGEAWLQLPVLGYSGGFEDGLIEDIHKLGFEQSGRAAIPKDQVRIVLIQDGQLKYYSNASSGPQVLDPVLGYTQRVLVTPASSLALSGQVKPALMPSRFDMRAGWDTGLQLSGRWSPLPALDLYYGFGGVHRESGSRAFNRFGFRDQRGAHLMVECLHNATWRPFFQLLYLSGSTFPMAGQRLNLPSLQHDLGVHWMLGRNQVLTLRYLNNITHNENTADIAFMLEYSLRSGAAAP